MEIDGVKVQVVDEDWGQAIQHSPVERPTRDQETRWQRQLAAEEEEQLPFTDEDD